MFISRVRILAALLAAASVTAPVAAEDTTPSAEAAGENIQHAIAFTQNLTADAGAALNGSGDLAAFRDVLADALALDVIADFMIADASDEMTDEQRARYDAVFPQYLTTLYAEQFQQIAGQDLEVVDSRETSRGDVIVRTQFERSRGQPDHR